MHPFPAAPQHLTRGPGGRAPWWGETACVCVQVAMLRVELSRAFKATARGHTKAAMAAGSRLPRPCAQAPSGPALPPTSASSLHHQAVAPGLLPTTLLWSPHIQSVKSSREKEASSQQRRQAAANGASRWVGCSTLLNKGMQGSRADEQVGKTHPSANDTRLFPPFSSSISEPPLRAAHQRLPPPSAAAAAPGTLPSVPPSSSNSNLSPGESLLIRASCALIWHPVQALPFEGMSRPLAAAATKVVEDPLVPSTGMHSLNKK